MQCTGGRQRSLETQQKRTVEGGRNHHLLQGHRLLSGVGLVDAARAKHDRGHAGPSRELARVAAVGHADRFSWQAECLETSAPGSAGVSRVLVVEDAEVYAMLLRRAFEAAGWQVETASDVAQARARLAASPFDLLLTDLHLPDGGAHEVLAAARRPGLRRVVMSADLDAEASELPGADSVVAKGADTALFVARILATLSPAAV